ncbi:hypothetical protein H0H93_007100 [Arthromyces matolae]|nr:hypothetical protein H0H93_007100 [Arthromyces matolae]
MPVTLEEDMNAPDQRWDFMPLDYPNEYIIRNAQFTDAYIDSDWLKLDEDTQTGPFFIHRPKNWQLFNVTDAGDGPGSTWSVTARNVGTRIVLIVSSAKAADNLWTLHDGIFSASS